MRLPRLIGVLAGLALIGCEQTSSPFADADPRSQRTAGLELEQDELGSVSGTGQYDLAGLIVTFSFNAQLEKNGKGKGEFTLFVDEGDGLLTPQAYRHTFGRHPVS